MVVDNPSAKLNTSGHVLQIQLHREFCKTSSISRIFVLSRARNQKELDERRERVFARQGNVEQGETKDVCVFSCSMVSRPTDVRWSKEEGLKKSFSAFEISAIQSLISFLLRLEKARFVLVAAFELCPLMATWEYQVQSTRARVISKKDARKNRARANEENTRVPKNRNFFDRRSSSGVSFEKTLANNRTDKRVKSN